MIEPREDEDDEPTLDLAAGERRPKDDDVELDERDLWEEGDPEDRRRDPLRKP